MKIFQGYQEFSSPARTAVSVGMFDGVHLGHQELISQLKICAADPGYQTGILTFWPHPRLAFDPDADLHLLTTIEEKCRLLECCGLDFIILQPFDEDFRQLEASAYIQKVLIDRLKVRHLIIGHDHVFGKNKGGNLQILQHFQSKGEYTVREVPAVVADRREISSTQIRKALHAGKVREAAAMLGRPYSVSGEVVHGKKIGRTLGYPTANLKTDSQKLIPAAGAYIANVSWRGQDFAGMVSVGTNPTLGENPLTVEVYLLDFAGDLYGETLQLSFLEYLHPQIKFESLEGLTARLQEDERLTRDYFAAP